jgi:surface carbohydrate biosynthesis protein (TIGR04326 family)
MSNTLLICEGPESFQHGYDIVLYWESFNEDNDAISIPKTVEDRSEILRNSYLEWLYKFSRTKINGKRVIDHLIIRDDFSYWWMTLLVEKSQWKSKGLYKVFRLMALDLLLQQYNIKKINIVLSDKHVCQSVEQYCFENKIKINKSFVWQSVFITLFDVLGYILHALIVLLRFSFGARLTNKKNKEKQRKIGSVTFFSYFFNLDDRPIKKNIFYTYYWASLHTLIDKSFCDVNWIHMHLKSNTVKTPKKAKKLVEKFNDSTVNQMHTLLDCEIKWKTIIRVILDYSKLIWAGWKLRHIKRHFLIPGFNFNFWNLLQQDWKSSIFGHTAITGCLFLNLFEDKLGRLPKQRKGFFLLENQAWERSLVYAWKKAGHGDIIGVQHTVVSFWDLRHFSSLQEYNSDDKFRLIMPDFVALNGSAASEMYIAGKFPREKIIHLEALRYLYLNDLKVGGLKVKPSGKVRLLVLGDYIPEVVDKQLQLLFSVAKKIENFVEIILKPHPANDINIRKYKRYNLKVEITRDSLDLLSDRYDIAYASSSTASVVDVFLSGKMTLIMMTPQSFNMSPLRNVSGVRWIYTSNDLIYELQFIRHNRYKKNKECENFFFLDKELSCWKGILS